MTDLVWLAIQNGTMSGDDYVIARFQTDGTPDATPFFGNPSIGFSLNGPMGLVMNGTTPEVWVSHGFNDVLRFTTTDVLLSDLVDATNFNYPGRPCQMATGEVWVPTDNAAPAANICRFNADATLYVGGHLYVDANLYGVCAAIGPDGAVWVANGNVGDYIYRFNQDGTAYGGGNINPAARLTGVCSALCTVGSLMWANGWNGSARTIDFLDTSGTITDSIVLPGTEGCTDIAVVGAEVWASIIYSSGGSPVGIINRYDTSGTLLGTISPPLSATLALGLCLVPYGSGIPLAPAPPGPAWFFTPVDVGPCHGMVPGEILSVDVAGGGFGYVDYSYTLVTAGDTICLRSWNTASYGGASVTADGSGSAPAGGSFRAPSLRPHSLILCVIYEGAGTTTWYQGGTATTVTVAASGVLAFCMNDDAYGDNSGSWTVTVKGVPVALAAPGQPECLPVAGTGGSINTGDGGPATSAAVCFPYALAVDTAGDLFIGVNSGVRMITSGTIDYFAGHLPSYNFGFAANGPAGTAMGTATGLVALSATTVLAVDAGSQVVTSITSGAITIVAGTSNVGGTSGDGGPATLAKLSGPVGICADAGGGYYIGCGGATVRYVDAGGTISTFAGTMTHGSTGDGGLATAAELDAPYAVALNNAQTILYIADFAANVIRAVDLGTGIISTICGTPYSTARVTGDGGLATSATMDGPQALCVDANDDLYIADGLVIRKLHTATGMITALMGFIPNPDQSHGDGYNPLVALSEQIFGLAVDSSFTLYFTDQHSQRVRKVTHVDTV